jgi:spore maturation protein CgeB
MRIVMFYHSLVSDWNHGNAHFLRGVVSELLARGHHVTVYEPRDAWSVRNLMKEHGSAPLRWFARAYPTLSSVRYSDQLSLESVLDGADLVLVHEWNDPDLVWQIGEMRARGGRFQLLFHDTHHRALTNPSSMTAYELSHYDGVLVFGAAIREIYRQNEWADRVWVWHEAADPRLCDAATRSERTENDLVWIGNWGDDERTAELSEYLIEPVSKLGLRTAVYGVRYPKSAQSALAKLGIAYRGWLPNFRVPGVFAKSAMTIHVPRRPYAETLRGIPTIRVFEALACGIPLVSAPWHDDEKLFTPGKDYLAARSGAEMIEHLRALREDPETAQALAEHGRRTIGARHTCAHRVTELLDIARQLGISTSPETRAA